MSQDPRNGLVERVSAILEEAGIFINADLAGDVLRLSGEVDSAEDRQAAIDVATALGATAHVSVVSNISILDLGSEATEEEKAQGLADASSVEAPLDSLHDRD